MYLVLHGVPVRSVQARHIHRGNVHITEDLYLRHCLPIPHEFILVHCDI